MNIKPATMRRIQNRAYCRAADLAKIHAEHWEAEAGTGNNVGAPGEWSAKGKAGYWRIIEKAFRDLAQDGT
jgi:hypothetical protein